MTVCIVRGSGDIGSAVAHALFTSGFPVVIHDVTAPAYPRRGRAFLDALFDGHSRLEGVDAWRADDLPTLERFLSGGTAVAITSTPFLSVLDAFHPSLLVDARMRKRAVPEIQRGLAALTVGLGPNFVAGVTTDVVVETAWGDELGRVIVSGPSAAFTGVPRVVAGHGRDRYGYAPAAGRFESPAALGIRVSPGEEIGRIGDIRIPAPIEGALVGLTRSGIGVARGAKILEVDPRGDRELAFGIGERARAVASGVLRAMRASAAFSNRRNMISIMARQEPALRS